MKKYVIELDDDLSNVYEDIAKMNNKKVEECLCIILDRVIRTMPAFTASRFSYGISRQAFRHTKRVKRRLPLPPFYGLIMDGVVAYLKQNE